MLVLVMVAEVGRALVVDLGQRRVLGLCLAVGVAHHRVAEKVLELRNRLVVLGLWVDEAC